MSVPVQRRVEPGEWHEAVRSARAEGYAFFDWLSAVDESDAQEGDAQDGDAPGGDETQGEPLVPGLEVLCHLLRVGAPGPGGLRRLVLRTRVPEGTPLRSVTDLFAGAAWHERETHEMFGLLVEGFDDRTGLGLRPLLLPEGFEGTPLRKDFVLAARASKPWPGAKEPGEGSGEAPPRGRRPRKRLLPPGVPDPSWGPRPD
ncbi:NADH-quinone oxidoreductase subunit C [Serinicoccus sediminis]|uniref:NADH-quinone oxidoreductase subunit C n=1 Tax=Serinicoccus sediminis TaxID=2306021 RepID=UPI001021A69D|nr:NADH-quinone oxidoreductase subunit C [Serinicoccus sediminis]